MTNNFFNAPSFPIVPASCLCQNTHTNSILHVVYRVMIIIYCTYVSNRSECEPAGQPVIIKQIFTRTSHWVPQSHNTL